MLYLPGCPEFDFTLATALPPGSQDCVFIASAGSGILRAVSSNSPEYWDYLEGGEYDQRLEEIGEDVEFFGDDPAYGELADFSSPDDWG